MVVKIEVTQIKERCWGLATTDKLSSILHLSRFSHLSFLYFTNWVQKSGLFITSPSLRVPRPRVPRLRVPRLRVPLLRFSPLRVPRLRVPRSTSPSPMSHVPPPTSPSPTSPSPTSQSSRSRPTLSHSPFTSLEAKLKETKCLSESTDSLTSWLKVFISSSLYTTIDPDTSSTIASSSCLAELLLAIFWVVFTGFSRFLFCERKRFFIPRQEF